MPMLNSMFGDLADELWLGWMAVCGVAWGAWMQRVQTRVMARLQNDGLADAQADTTFRAPAVSRHSAVRSWPLLASHSLIWLACAAHGPNVSSAVAWAVWASTLLSLSVIDWQTTYLPDALTLPLLCGGLLASALSWIATPLDQALLGAVLGYGLLWIVATAFARVTGKEGMGGGDFKLLAAMGAWLGPMALLPVLWLASCAGAALGWWWQRRGVWPAGSAMPFGPFLSAAACIVAWHPLALGL